ncbi:hypothetical protein O3M35_001140 [Rhynocoris fuscipes]|uniref:NADH dehydrogenase [ubiquinone] 1 alpha subcomplex subunit 2 n=1 Tax=Rhynocoris fuscipes TaxID=488301 RepID=A0AAW1DPX7_9HEMI
MANLVKFGRAIREIRMHLCQTSQSSKGVRDFIEKYYVDIKKSNPSVPILIRECEGVQPKLWARMELGKEESSSLKDLSAEQVLEQVKKVANKNPC